MELPGILHLYLISTINNCVVIIGDEVVTVRCDITPWRWFSGANIEAPRLLFTHTLA